MTNAELFKKIETAFEMVISINGKHFTITNENEHGFSIAEHNKPDSEKLFPDADSLIGGYMIEGKRLRDYAELIRIEDYTGC